ncbi:MAG TPA: hypothetical protein PKW35_05265 [Nannocystaceae bacterium]|nr:hypothetical protein [Nannocystaceae bacterium]
MSKPSHEQLAEVFNALVTNGFDFFVRSAHELVKDQKFSIAHFATGLELLLKAALFHEHWTLIATDPHNCAWTGVKDGTVRTIQASDLCAVITSTTGTPLNHEKAAFESVFKHRNRVLHWAPNGDLAATVAEQCLAWHHLRNLLAGSWKEPFEPFQKRIDEVEKLLRAHRLYLQVRFDQHEKKLRGMENARRLLMCPTCGFRAGVATDGTERVISFECLVCGYTGSAARVACDALYALDDLPVDSCECGDTHDREQLLDALDPTPLLRPKEMSFYEPDRGHCGECFDIELTVAPNGGSYVCIACGMQFDPEDSTNCEWCNERWFGWDSEGSYLTGCEHCDGHGMEDD